MVTTAPLESLRDKIQKHLPDATPDQVGRFALQVERLEELQRYFQKYPEDLDGWKDKSGAPINELARAIKALDYKRSYRIAMIGLTGAGKSTLLNALLGRSLVLMKDIGKPATGAALEIFLDVSEGGIEKAEVSYRDQSNIYSLVKDFVERYQLDASGLTGKFDAGFATAIRNLQPHNSLTEGVRTEFEELRKTLADIVIQYANNSNNKLRQDFVLANATDVRELMELIDENSTINSENNPQRRIGLVKAVTYHIKPYKNSNGLPTLQLPGNVCLVDLPGLDGTPLHDIIISEGIKDADAVVFILGSRRILGRGEAYLLNRVRKYISLEGSTQSGDRIFLVLNAIDSIMVDDRGKLDNLPKDMQDLMDLLVPNYATYFRNRGGEYPYFMTSAWAAYVAQKQLNGEPIEDIKTYGSVKTKLGVEGRGDREVLEASQIPKLVEELTKFAREHRIEGQIRDGKLALDSIIDTLINNFQKSSQNINRKGTSYLAEKKEEILKERQKDQEKLVKQIRQIQEQRLENSRSELQKIAQSICDNTDRIIKTEKMPNHWKKSFLDLEDRLTHSNIAKPIYEYILTEAQIDLWYELTDQVPSMANHLIRDYTDTVETSQIAEKISDGCYGYVEVSLLKSTIKEKIDANMRRTLPEIASRIAMLWMTNPDFYFTKSADGQPEKKQLFDSLAGILRQPDVKSDYFSPFIAEMRKLYEPFVDKNCIIGILNLYRYEMIVIEDLLLGYIKDVFSEIKDRYSNDAILKAKINESLSNDPSWKRLELIERKLAILKTIKS